MLDRAAVSTIHGFCFSVLREYAFEAGELFTQEVSDVDASFADLFDRYVHGELGRYLLTLPDWEERAMELVREGFDRELLESAFKFFQPETSRLVPEPGDPFDPRPLCQSVIQGLSHVSTEGGSPSNRATIIAARTALETSFSAHSNPESLSRALYLDRVWRRVFVTAERRINSHIEGILENEVPDHGVLIEGLFALDDNLAAEQRRLHTHIVRELVRCRPLWLRRQGRIDYRDMLVRTRAALECSAALVAALRRRFAVALVDEFQDTDPIQWQIFSRLFAGVPGHQLVLVGDTKQAIYAFRGADVRTFRTATAQLLDIPGASLQPLLVNFRTAGTLVRAINHLFSAGKLLEDFVPVEPYDQNPRSLLVGGLPDSRPFRVIVADAPTGSRARCAYSSFVAAEIGEMLGAGTSFRDRHEIRPLLADDICILVRGGSDERDVVNALKQAGIPYVSGRHPALLQTVEAREIRLVLEAIADPQSQSAVKKALLTRFLFMLSNSKAI